MIRLLTTIYLAVFIVSLSFGQDNNIHHCGTNHHQNSLIKDRMLRNRAHITPHMLQTALNNRSTRYIPTAIHLVGNNEGKNFANVNHAINMLCRLNADFKDQNLVFYLADPVGYIYDNDIHEDAYNTNNQQLMQAYKIPDAVNIFVNANASRPVAGYYTPAYDFVFIANSFANGTSTTITHEMGHFFTLPHTFLGWEGVDARDLYGGQSVPSMINGSRVEHVARTGIDANCSFAGDGFCDTEADYISKRVACPISTNLKDPTGVNITPDPSLFMSYASDDCMNKFSQEQKAAILSDILSRGWNNFTAPSTSDTVFANSITAISPLDGSLVNMTTSDSIRLEWDDSGAEHATTWILKIEWLFMNIPVEITYFKSIANQNYVSIPKSILESNRKYRWSVKPMTAIYTCASFSNFFTFQTDVSSNVLNSSNTLTNINIFPNPTNNQTIHIKIQSTTNQLAQIRIYSFDGRMIYTQQNLHLEAGSQVLKLAATTLETGNYMLVFQTEEGSIQKQLTIKN